jgi:hypothetical protein
MVSVMARQPPTTIQNFRQGSNEDQRSSDLDQRERAVAVKTRAVSRIAKVPMPTVTGTNSKNGMTLITRLE